MSLEKVVHPDRARTTLALSDGVLCDGWLYVSGQGALDMTTGKIVGESIEDQVRLTLDHVGKILNAAGCSFDDVVKCTCHLSDIKEFERFNRAYGEYFKSIRPARTTVQSGLGPGMKVEIDAIARMR
jgi:2-iminobutanoate/2-iminopropanoate deaminase